MSSTLVNSQMQSQSRPAPGCGFLLIWVLSNLAGVILGVLIGGILGAVLSVVFRIIIPSGGLASLFFLLDIGMALFISGAVIGLAQWLVLRRFAIMSRWVLATALGWMVGMGFFLFSLFFLEFDSRGVPAIVVFALVGLDVAWRAILGSTQWFVLRKPVSRSGLWILTNAAAWAVGALGAMASNLVGTELLGLHPPTDPRIFEIPAAVMFYAMLLLLFSLLLAVFLFTLITGLGLMWLFKKVSTPLPPSA
jgi:hypothetical protein